MRFRIFYYDINLPVFLEVNFSSLNFCSKTKLSYSAPLSCDTAIELEKLRYSYNTNDQLILTLTLTLTFLLQININEMNKLKNEMVRDEVIMNNRMEWS